MRSGWCDPLGDFPAWPPGCSDRYSLAALLAERRLQLSCPQLARLSNVRVRACIARDRAICSSVSGRPARPSVRGNRFVHSRRASPSRPGEPVAAPATRHQPTRPVHRWLSPSVITSLDSRIVWRPRPSTYAILNHSTPIFRMRTAFDDIASSRRTAEFRRAQHRHLTRRGNPTSPMNLSRSGAVGAGADPPARIHGSRLVVRRRRALELNRNTSRRRAVVWPFAVSTPRWTSSAWPPPGAAAAPAVAPPVP